MVLTQLSQKTGYGIRKFDVVAGRKLDAQSFICIASGLFSDMDDRDRDYCNMHKMI